MKECKYCKTLNKDDYVYCISCGRKLASAGSRSLPDLKGVKLNKKTILAIAGALLLLAAGIFLFTRPSGKNAYYLSEDKVQVITGEQGMYFFEGSIRKADLPDTVSDKNIYSFDSKTLLFNGIKNEEGGLYVYRNGKVDLISNSFSKEDLSDTGEYVFYKNTNDGLIHLYQVSNKKDRIVTANEEEAESFDEYVLSYSGSVLAYTSGEGNEKKLHLYGSSGDKVLPAEDVFELVAVSEKGEVFYHNSDGHLMVSDTKGSSLVSDEYDVVCANVDYSQIMVIGSDGFVLYEKGKRGRGSFEEVGGYRSILIPDKTLTIGYYRYDGGGLYASFYHVGVSDLKQLFFLSENKDIFQIGKDLTIKKTCEGVKYYSVGSDGKTLIWMDEESGVHLYDGSSSDFNCGEDGVRKIYTWDSQNKVLYFQNENGTLSCSDGKNVYATEQKTDPSTYVCGKDGYFYFKDGGTLYALNRSGEVTEVGELYSSGSSNSSEDFYGRNGIIYKGSDKEIYFVRNAQAVRLNTGENQENS